MSIDVSIIIPNYNGATYLREAIDSAVSQAGVEVEVIVVDDGSTDASREVIDSYGDSIHSIFQKNLGACAARNAGLAIAKGKYVKFLDGDDCLLPNSLDTQLLQSTILEKTEGNRCVVYGDACLIDASGRVLRHNAFSKIGEGREISAQDMISHSPLTSMPLHRTFLLREIGGFDVQMPAAQEYDLHLRLYFAGIKFVYNSTTCYQYRQYESVDRISTKRHDESSFNRRFTGYEKHLSLASDHFNQQIPQAVKTAFAHVFWETGRFALRCEERDVAMRYFKKSKSLSARDYISGSKWYGALCHCVGPIWAERITELRTNLVRGRTVYK